MRAFFTLIRKRLSTPSTPCTPRSSVTLPGGYLEMGVSSLFPQGVLSQLPTSALAPLHPGGPSVIPGNP